MVTMTPGRFGLVNISVTPGRTQGLTPDGVVRYFVSAGCPEVVVPAPYRIDQVPVIRLVVERGLARWSGRRAIT